MRAGRSQTRAPASPVQYAHRLTVTDVVHLLSTRRATSKSSTSWPRAASPHRATRRTPAQEAPAQRATLPGRLPSSLAQPMRPPAGPAQTLPWPRPAATPPPAGCSGPVEPRLLWARRWPPPTCMPPHLLTGDPRGLLGESGKGTARARRGKQSLFASIKGLKRLTHRQGPADGRWPPKSPLLALRHTF